VPNITERNKTKYSLTTIKMGLAEVWQLCSSVNCDMVWTEAITVSQTLVECLGY
jgi:hypothetical protein